MTSQERANVLWENFYRTRGAEQANDLVVHYLQLVRFAALRLARYSASAAGVDADDLIQYGAMGLRRAVHSFDPGRGVKFETYCCRRIKGAMLDGIKAQQWAPRDERRKLAALAAARTASMAETGEPPADETLAQRVGVCPTVVRSMERAAASLVRVSLESSSDDEDRTASVADERAASPDDRALRADLRHTLMNHLPRAQRLVLTLYYYEGMTMREIGATLGVSPTRASQLHSQALQRTREKLSRPEMSASLC